MPSQVQAPSSMAPTNTSPRMTSVVTGFELDAMSVVSREKICGYGAIFRERAVRGKFSVLFKEWTAKRTAGVRNGGIAPRGQVKVKSGKACQLARAQKHGLRGCAGGCGDRRVVVGWMFGNTGPRLRLGLATGRSTSRQSPYFLRHVIIKNTLPYTVKGSLYTLLRQPLHLSQRNFEQVVPM